MTTQTASKEANVSILETINDGFSSVIQQLVYAQKRVNGDDMSQKFLSNCIEGLQVLAQDLASIANNDVDQFNALLDDIESRGMAVAMLQLEVANAKDEMDVMAGRLAGVDAEIAEAIERAQFEFDLTTKNLEAKVKQLKIDLEQKSNIITTLGTAKSNLKSDNKRFQIMEPEKLKKQNVALKKQGREDRQLISELNEKFNTQVSANSLLKKDNALLMATVEAQRGQLQRAERQIRNIDGVLSGYKHEALTAEGTPIHFFIKRMFLGLDVQVPDSQRPRYINNLDFTFSVWVSVGIATIAHVNEWLHPTYHIDNYLLKFWPADLNEALHELYREEIEKTHPQLVKRVEWAESVSLHDVAGIPEAARKALAADGLTRLIDVLKYGEDTLAETKGIGAKTAASIRKICQDAADDWDRANGAPEVRTGKEPK